jgi:hypothetical protein
MKLKYEMNSRERILCSMNFEEPDHVPVYFLFKDYGEKYNKRSGFTFGNFYRYDVREPFSIQHEIKRVEETLKLGIDDTLRLHPPLGEAEEYNAEGVEGLKSAVNTLNFKNDKERSIEKIYHTPEGDLKTIVKETDDWVHGKDIPLFSDYSQSRSKEFLIKTKDDLKKLKYLLGKPKKEEYKKFKEEAEELRMASKRLGVVLESGRTALGDSVVWLMGLQNMIMKEYDDPDMVLELLDMLCDWEEDRAEMLVDEGIEVLVHAAWYEITDFWTPENYRKFLKPRVKRLVKIAKDSDVKFKYIITKSTHDLKNDLLEIGVDSIMGVDPIQGNADLVALKNDFKNKITIWGGMNAAITLGRGTKNEIENATESAIKTLAPGGGFILYPVDILIADANPWDNIEIMLNKWKEISNYPII